MLNEVFKVTQPGAGARGQQHLRGNTWLYFGDVDSCGLI